MSAEKILSFLEDAIPAAQDTLSKVEAEDIDAHRVFVMSVLRVLLAYATTAVIAWRSGAFLAIPLLARSALETRVEIRCLIKDPYYYLEMKEEQVSKNAVKWDALNKNPNQTAPSNTSADDRKILRDILKERQQKKTTY